MKYIKLCYLGLTFSFFTSIYTESLSAQTARISASAIFANGQTQTFDNTQSIVQQNFDATGNLISQTTTPTSVLQSSVSGAITTVSAESALPTGFYYAGSVSVAPAYASFGGSTVVSSLSVSSGAVTPVGPANSFTQAAASILLQAASGIPTNLTSSQLDAAVALIKAGAGINGLD